MDHQTESQLLETKHTLYKYVSSIAGILALLFSTFNFFILDRVGLALTEAIFGLLNLYCFWIAISNKVLVFHRNVSLFTITFVMLYVFSISDLRTGAIYWLLLLPLIYCLLTGPKVGFTYALVLFFPISYILFIKSDVDANIAYRSVINFTVTYFLSYAACSFYEVQNIKHRQLLHKMAFKDPLTGSKNRHALKRFFEKFNQESISSTTNKQYEKTQLLLIDIDHFKKVNDQFGHAIGDHILVDVAELLFNYISNQNVYRIGGEEFLITLKKASSIQAYDVAEMLRKKIEQHSFNIESNNITLTVSIGVSELKQGADFNSFLRNADQNLYHAKNQGRNTVHHDGHLIS